MGYTRTDSVVNTLSTTNDETLAVWKAHFLEMHSAIVASGWVQTGDTGQLDISAVATMPTRAYAGYRIYEIDDDLSAAGYSIYMKLEFGTNSETGSNVNYGYHSGSTPSVKVSFGMKTDGAGALQSQAGTSLAGNLSLMQPGPQYTSTSGYSSSFTRPASKLYICKNNARGFCGIVFYCNGRGYNNNGGNWAYNASSLAFFLQRTLSSSGAPTSEGFTVVTPLGDVNGAYRWPNDFANSTYLNNTSGYSYTSNTVVSGNDMHAKPGGLLRSGSKIQTGPCYMFDGNGDICLNPNIVTLGSLDLAEGVQFPVEVTPGDIHTFIALGPGTGMCPDRFGAQNSFAMLYE